MKDENLADDYEGVPDDGKPEWSDEPNLEKRIVPPTPETPAINPGVFEIPPQDDVDEEGEVPEQRPTIN